MNIFVKAAWIVALLFGSTHAWAELTTSDAAQFVSFGCGAGTSTYEIWLYNDDVRNNTSDPARLWTAAQAFAASRSLERDGAVYPGHLATFTNAVEEACVLEQAARLKDAMGVHILGPNKQLWIGLVQSDGDLTDGFEWVGESMNLYENWGPNEPNDAGPGEDHGTIGRYGYEVTDGHNDEAPTRNTLYGIVIEYDVAALGTVVLDCPQGNCKIQIPSANPERNFIAFEAEGGEADVQTFLIQESCAALNNEDPFGSRPVTFTLSDGNVETIQVANYLCDDRWTLISSETTGVFIDSGVVEAEFEAADFGLSDDGCTFDPDLPLAGQLPLADPLAPDHVAWLPGTEQWGSTDGQFPRPANYMQDFLYDCGSSRGLMRKNRYFGVGLNLYFQGLDFLVPAQAELIKARLIELEQKGLDWLLQTVEDARSRGVIKQGDYQKMRQKILGAQSDIANFEFEKAEQKLADLFSKFLNKTKYKTQNQPDDLNFDGETIARISNLLHLLNFYIQPYYP